MTCSLGLFFTLRLLMLSLLLLNFGLLVVESSTALGSRECFAPAGALLQLTALLSGTSRGLI
jgi:hypothetical protein